VALTTATGPSGAKTLTFLLYARAFASAAPFLEEHVDRRCGVASLQTDAEASCPKMRVSAQQDHRVEHRSGCVSRAERIRL
jgi:hypothetical protein